MGHRLDLTDTRHSLLSPGRLAQFFRQIGAERIEHIDRMQEAFDWCATDDALAVGEQKRLAQLAIPATEAQERTFEAVQREVGR